MSITTIDVIQNMTLLEIMEHKGIPIQTHCRSGYCGVCRTQLIQGEVDYTIEPLGFVDEDEILPCCCIPKTSLQIQLN